MTLWPVWLVEYRCSCLMCRYHGLWSSVGCTPKIWQWLARVQAWLLRREQGCDTRVVNIGHLPTRAKPRKGVKR